jgi:hypothetical protein
MKLIFVLVTALMTIHVSAAETLKIQTPRGTDLSVTMHIPQGTNLPVLIVAPGQSCNSKGPLFETMGSKGFEKNYAIFRFEWGYCGTSNEKPSAGLKNEIEDMVTVLEFAKTHASVDPLKIVMAGKSMGTGVAYKIFSQRPELKAIVLLTPICSYTTDENNNPLPMPLSVCDKNYPHLKEDLRPILMAMGSQDDACVLPVLFDFLKDSKGNIQTFVAGGDHGFRIYDDKGNVNSAKTQNNIDTVVGVILNWMDLIF